METFMKTIMLLALLISSHSFASETVLEFDEAQEMKCNVEAKNLKCVNSLGEEVSSCLESKKSQLSKNCLAMHTTKMRKN